MNTTNTRMTRAAAKQMYRTPVKIHTPCDHHVDPRMSSCGASKRISGIQCGKRVSKHRADHYIREDRLPVCATHQAVILPVGRCQALEVCGQRCNRLTVFKPHENQRCDAHEEAQITSYFSNMPKELRQEVFTYVAPPGQVGHVLRRGEKSRYRHAANVLRVSKTCHVDMNYPLFQLKERPAYVHIDSDYFTALGDCWLVDMDVYRRSPFALDPNKFQAGALSMFKHVEIYVYCPLVCWEKDTWTLYPLFEAFLRALDAIQRVKDHPGIAGVQECPTPRVVKVTIQLGHFHIQHLRGRLHHLLSTLVMLFSQAPKWFDLGDVVFDWSFDLVVQTPTNDGILMEWDRGTLNVFRQQIDPTDEAYIRGCFEPAMAKARAPHSTALQAEFADLWPMFREIRGLCNHLQSFKAVQSQRGNGTLWSPNGRQDAARVNENTFSALLNRDQPALETMLTSLKTIRDSLENECPELANMTFERPGTRIENGWAGDEDEQADAKAEALGLNDDVMKAWQLRWPANTYSASGVTVNARDVEDEVWQCEVINGVKQLRIITPDWVYEREGIQS